MNAIAGAQEFIHKNRLLVAVSGAWLLISNLLYFSQVGALRCISLHQGFVSTTSQPAWLDAWNELSMGYIALYGSTLEAGDISCWTRSFSSLGYLSFIALPVAVVGLLVATAKWVNRA